MEHIYFVAIFTSLIVGECFAFDLGVSSSGKDASLEAWSARTEQKRIGVNFKLITDFEKYRNDTLVTICSDGAISGSVGSGTCSGHGGASHTDHAKFSRYAFVGGATYWITDQIQLHGGLMLASYSSNINIGEKDSKDFTKTGLDFGISFKPLPSSGFKVMVGKETEQKRTYLGFRVSI